MYRLYQAWRGESAYRLKTESTTEQEHIHIQYRILLDGYGLIRIKDAVKTL